MENMQKLLTVYLFLFVVCASSFQVPMRGTRNDAGLTYVCNLHRSAIICERSHIHSLPSLLLLFISIGNVQVVYDHGESQRLWPESSFFSFL
jgi:hypothetical protein